MKRLRFACSESPFFEKLAHRGMADRMPAGVQGFLQFPQRLAYPLVVGAGVAGNVVSDQLLEIVFQRRIGLGQRFASCPGSTNALPRARHQLLGQLSSSLRKGVVVHVGNRRKPGNPPATHLQRQKRKHPTSLVFVQSIQYRTQRPDPMFVVQPRRGILADRQNTDL